MREHVRRPGQPLPPPSELSGRTLTFIPEAARRPDKEQPASFLGDPLPPTLVIDYQLLAKLPPTPSQTAPTAAKVAQPATPGAPATSPATVASATAPTGQPVEAEALEEELRTLKDLVIKKDMELEALKKELKSVRRQLAERDAQVESLKRKGRAPSKSQETPP